MDFLSLDALTQFATFGGFAATILGGILGNRADETFRGLCGQLGQRMKRLEPPANHDLQRAFRRSWVQASLLLVDACRADGGGRRLLSRSSAFDPLRRAYRDELGRIGTAEYTPPAGAPDAGMSLLLQPQAGLAADRAAEMRAALEARLLAEAVEVLGDPLPDPYQQRLRDGWEAKSGPGIESLLTWWDALCAFFAQELKHNQVVANIFQGQILAELRVEGEPLTAEAFQGQLELHGRAVLARLDSIQEAVSALGFRQAADAEAVQRRLDRLGEGLDVQEWMLADIARSLQSRAGASAAAYAELRLLIRERLDRNPPFRGRAAQQHWLDALLARPSGRLVVTAPAGYGKTALMAHWLDALIERGYHVAYHFFDDHRDATRCVETAVASLLGQVQEYFGIHDAEIPTRHDEAALTLSRLVRRGGTAARPLVLLIEGLDEAERAFSPPFPDELPPHVYLVASARAGAGEHPPCLEGWGERPETHRLDRLTPASVREWLQDAGEGELAAVAADAGFVAAVQAACEGYPLYLKVLVDELVRGAQAGADLHRMAREMPCGLTKYADAELDRLERLDPSGRPTEGVRRCFTVLAAALGPLRTDELKALADARDRDLRLLRQHWQVSRWLDAAGEGNETQYRFAHPALGRAFREALGDDAEDAQQTLLEWCAGWDEHRKPYALKYYAFHLRDAGRWDDLTELFGNPDFFQAGEDSAFLRWYRFEDGAWQRLLCDWVVHRMRAPNQEAARLAVATVYFDAHWWWGGFLPWPYTEELAASLRAVTGWQHDPVLSEIVRFHDAYAHQRDYRGRHLLTAEWEAAGEALRRLRHSLNLDGPLEAYRLDSNRDGRLRLRMLSAIYLGECCHYLGDPRAYRPYAEAAWLLRRREGGDLLLSDDSWTLPWITWQRAEFWASRGCLRRSERACLRGLGQVDTTDAPEVWDWEVRANIHRTLAAVLQAQGCTDAAWLARDLSWALAFRFHSQPHPSPPDVYSLAFNRLACDQWLDAALGDPSRAPERCRTLRGLWAPQWDAAPAEVPDSVLQSWVHTEDRSALNAWVFPPEPDEGDPQFPDRLMRWFRAVEPTLDGQEARLLAALGN